MTDDAERKELLDLYKLHTELADRVSQRREGANRLYVSLLAGLAAFLAVLLRFGVGDFSVRLVLGSVGAVGIALSASWYVVLRSYRQLNSGKFQALFELESKLSYPFFQREWDLLGAGQDRSRYWRLTVVEVGLPCIFFVIFAALLVVSFLVEAQ